MDSKPDRKGPDNADDRRASTRHDTKELGTVVARVLGRCDARLLDVSHRGVLFESEARLPVGDRTTIRITTVDTSVAMTGTVVRSRVATLGKSVMYQTALELDEDLSVFDTICEPRTFGRSTMLPSAYESVPKLRVDNHGNVHAPDGDVLRGEEVEFTAIVTHDLSDLQRRARARPAIL